MVATRTNRIEAIFQRRAGAAGRHPGDARPRADTERRREGLGGDEARHGRPHPGADRGRKPGFSPETAQGLRILESLDEVVREVRLVRRY